jgi:hypothetical protein
MITEDELTKLLHRAGDAVSVPKHGPSAIRVAAGADAPAPATRRVIPMRRREWAFAGTGIAAVAALIGILLTSGGTPVPSGVAPLEKNPAASQGVASSRSTPATFGTHAAALPPKTGANSASAKSSARDIIATGTLHLSVRAAGLSATVDNLESLAARFGGYVGLSNVIESGRNLGGTLVLDVPASSFQSLIDRARHAGTVRSLTTSDQDVTSQVVDLGARLTALEDERAQLEVLLSKSAKVSDLLQVENQIEFVQSQIEQIQGQQRVLSQQVAFSALTVHVAVPAVAHHKATSTGFAHAWHVAVSSFVGAVKAFVSVLGDIAFAMLAAIAALVLAFVTWRKGWPALRRRFV